MTKPLLCATVAAASIDDLRRQRDEAACLADMVELRLDFLPQPDVGAAIAGREGPVMVTCRPRWEGGRFEGPEEVRLGLLHQAADLGAEYVDVEWQARDEEWVRARRGRGVVLSMHDFGGTPRDLDERYAAMCAVGAEVVKLSVMARSLRDCLRLMWIGQRARADRRRAALVAMGMSGMASRILPERFGSCWTYAGEGIAPGQLTIDRLVNEFRFRERTAASGVYGLAGRPVIHSLSPAIHNAAFRACGVDAVYLPLEAEDADDFDAFAAAMGMAGASVTAPFKTAMLDHADTADAMSRRIGAANTLRWRDGRCEARNTDIAGFLAPLADEPLDGVRTAVLGSGGAARAVVAGLASRGARVTVYGRTLERALEVAGTEQAATARAGLPLRGSWDVLVNATPVGGLPHVDASPMPAADLAGGRLVYDLVYNPPRTKLLQDAEAAGCRTVGGLEMLVAQAAAQFEWWTGVGAPVRAMRQAALARLAAGTARGEVSSHTE